MSRRNPSRKSRRVEKETEYGFEYWYQKYQQWVIAHEDKKVTYGVGSLLIALVLIAVAILLPLPQQVITLIAFPAGVLFFLIPLGFLLLAAKNDPERMTFKEKVPPSRRRRFAMFGALLLAVGLISLNDTLPYALGGAIMVAAALGLYNIARRTPEEIALALAGIPDPRETTVLVGDEEDALADTKEETYNSFEEEK